MTYVYLGLAIITEVAATSALKASGQFTKLIPSLIVILGYSASFYLLAIVTTVRPISMASPWIRRKAGAQS